METFIAMMAILAFIVILLLLLAGLIVAPWHIHLLILLVGLFTIRRLLEQNALRATLQDSGLSSSDPAAPSPPFAPSQPDHQSDLTYRGAHYSHLHETDAIATAHSPELHGQYRGSPWQQPSGPAELPPEGHKPGIVGKYRGSTWKSPNY
jgi:hypothetical protein